MTTTHPTQRDEKHRLPDDADIDTLVARLDAILDAWFMGEVAPAFRKESRRRPEPIAQAA